MNSGGQCVMTAGTVLMRLWSASSWDMHTLKVRTLFNRGHDKCQLSYVRLQVAEHTAMPTLVLAVDQFSWMMSCVA